MIIEDPTTPQMRCYTTLWNICVQQIAMLNNWVKQTAMQDSNWCKIQPLRIVIETVFA